MMENHSWNQPWSHSSPSFCITPNDIAYHNIQSGWPKPPRLVDRYLFPPPAMVMPFADRIHVFGVHMVQNCIECFFNPHSMISMSLCFSNSSIIQLCCKIYPMKYAYDFIVVWSWIVLLSVTGGAMWHIYLYPSVLVRWHWSNHTIVPVPMKNLESGPGLADWHKIQQITDRVHNDWKKLKIQYTTNL